MVHASKEFIDSWKHRWQLVALHETLACLIPF